MRVVLANCAFDPDIADPDALLARYHSLAGWAKALAEASDDAVTVVQRFGRDAHLRRGRVDYQFVKDDAPAFPPRWFLGRTVARTVARLEPDVVDVKGLVFPLLVRHLRLRLGVRTSIFVRDHGGFNEQSPSFRSWRGRTFYRFGLRVADGFLFTSRDQAAPWVRAGVIGTKNAVHEVLEASTDLASWPRDMHEGYRLPGRPALLWVGRLDANKDPLTALEGFARAGGALPDAALTMVYGEDELLAAVKARIARDPWLRTRVHLRGALPRSALPSLYAGADLFVLGSSHEVACFSLIEALSFGLTPVVTDIPPFRRLTDGGRMGALFSPGNAEALGRALERASQADFAASRQLTETYFERELSWSAIGRRALDIYRAKTLVGRASSVG
jgi:glycosyltransferase involved in cell wall biosynthesis